MKAHIRREEAFAPGDLAIFLSAVRNYRKSCPAELCGGLDDLMTGLQRNQTSFDEEGLRLLREALAAYSVPAGETEAAARLLALIDSGLQKLSAAK